METKRKIARVLADTAAQRGRTDAALAALGIVHEMPDCIASSENAADYVVGYREAEALFAAQLEEDNAA